MHRLFINSTVSLIVGILVKIAVNGIEQALLDRKLKILIFKKAVP